MTGRFVIGHILKTHGVKGELKVTSAAGHPERYRKGLDVQARWPDGRTLELRVGSARVAGELALVSFEGYPTLETALALRGAELTVPEEEALPPPPGGVRYGEVTGHTVRHTEDGRLLGVVHAVVTAVQDLLEVRTETGDMVLVPWVPALVPRIDRDTRTIWVDPPRGLFDDEAEVVHPDR
ncbi:MAG: ribosome maturation factor RimM [Candidatus Sericytochromatia bacterium]|nr:ribosome maturation factor RimM [Candidatus Sericytochromatia bacterium]